MLSSAALFRPDEQNIGVQFLAIEPVPAQAAALQRSIAANGWEGKVPAGAFYRNTASAAGRFTLLSVG